MAFEGDLRELELGDVLQTLAMTRQFGTLIVRSHEERRVAFTEKGLALLSHRPSHGERVGRLLVGTGRATAEALEAARVLVRRRRGAIVDEVLLEEGAATEEEVRQARRYIAQEDIFELFRWREGTFEFHAENVQPEGPFGDLWFDIGGIAMEAARRIDEMPGLEAAAPLGEVFVAYGTDAAPQPGVASDDLVRVFALSDGSRTVADVVDAFHLGAFDTRKRVASLVGSGSLRPATADEILHAVESVSDPARATHLLRRAVDRAPSEIAAWRLLADALASSGDRTGAADALAELARLRHMAGDGQSALETLRGALKLDRTNAVVHSHITRLHFALGQIEEGLDAARTATTQCLAGDAPETALDLAHEALTYRPDDVPLRRAAAAALAALGRPHEALVVLDEVAANLEAEGDDGSGLVEIYRSILRLQPDRTDCERRIEEFVAADAAKHRRRMHVLAVAAGVVVLALAAIPFFGGPTVQEHVDEATKAVDLGHFPDAREILDRLEGSALSEDEEFAIRNLRSRMDTVRHNGAATPLKAELTRKLEKRYAGATEAVGEGRMSAGFAILELAVAELATPEAREFERLAPDDYLHMKRELAEEARVLLATTEGECVALATKAFEVAEEFQASGALKRAALTNDPQDLQELERLVGLSDRIAADLDANDWPAFLASADRIVAAARPSNATARDRIRAAVETLNVSSGLVADAGGRARGYVHRTELLAAFRETNQQAADMKRVGRLEDAADLCQRYLEFCSSVRDGDHGDAYGPIVLDYLDQLPFEELLRTELDMVRDILDRERRAEEALESDDVEEAFRLRAELVRGHPGITFSSRFALPLRVTSRPPGAEILLADNAGERLVGTTPRVIEYPVSGPSIVTVRHAGFDDHVAERRGAVEDTLSSVAVDLLKHPLWVSEPGAHSESRPVAWQDRVFVADREGVIRALDRDTGAEVGRHETELLGGFAGAPVPHGDRLHAAGVDGVGFVLDARTLEVLHTYPVGAAVRAALLSTPRGVVVADDRGTVRMMGDDGREIWKRDVGAVMVDPAAAPSRVVVVTLDGELVVLSEASGDELHRVRIPGQPRWSAPVVSGNTAYVASEGGTVCGIALDRGRVVWQYTSEEPFTGRPAVVGNRVTVATMRGRILALDSAATDGEPLVIAEEGPLEDGLIALDDSRMAVVGRTGVVRGLTAERGELVWRFDAADAVSAHPALANGVIYVVTRAGRVIAIER